MNRNIHPARSSEFLSRLHDGELSAAERAHFESHRAHCAECRRSAAEFEAALSLFRSSRTSPASPDLAGRILKKIQSKTPRRSPLGISFGIDLRWAGAFAAALIAVIIGAEIVSRQKAPAPAATARRDGIPVLLQDGAERQAAGKTAPAPQSRARLESPARQSERELNLPKPQPSRDGSDQEKLAYAPAPAAPMEESESRRKPDELAPSDKSLAAENRWVPDASSAERDTARTARVAPAPVPKRREAAGGEGAAVSAFGELAATPRLLVEPYDGAGTPPALNEIEVDPFAPLRGQRFVLMVEASGRVREARPFLEKKEKSGAPQTLARSPTITTPDERTASPVLKLRFAPGDRPRRLLLKIE